MRPVELARWAPTESCPLFADQNTHTYIKKTEQLLEQCTAVKLPSDNTRYVHKLGVTVCDDIVQKATEHWKDKKKMPLTGSYIIRINKPVKCLFISYGFSGTMVPDGGICVTEGFTSSTTKDETFAISELLAYLNPTFSLSLRMQWMFIDLKEVDGEIIRKPTVDEVLNIKKKPGKYKNQDLEKYKLLRRITRNRDSKQADIPDGKEDSENERKEAFWAELMKKEERSNVRQNVTKCELIMKKCKKPSGPRISDCVPRGRGRPRGSRGRGGGVTSARSRLAQKNAASFGSKYHWLPGEEEFSDEDNKELEDSKTDPAGKKLFVPASGYSDLSRITGTDTSKQPQIAHIPDEGPMSPDSFMFERDEELDDDDDIEEEDIFDDYGGGDADD